MKSWRTVGEQLVKNGEKLVKLVKGWSTVGQTRVNVVNLVTLRFGLSTAGDETVKWKNCLRTHGTSRTPDTSV